LGLFFEAIDRFIMVSKVFWVKNRFLIQKNINLDFPATIEAEIWAKQATGRCFFFKKKKGRRTD
jgi:hypothetical protein